jgi:hypothetical protein
LVRAPSSNKLVVKFFKTEVKIKRLGPVVNSTIGLDFYLNKDYGIFLEFEYKQLSHVKKMTIKFMVKSSYENNYKKPSKGI